MAGDENSAEHSLLCIFYAVLVVFFILCCHHSEWLILVCCPSFLSRRCHRSLCFSFLLYRNHPVLSFSCSHKMTICFSSVCSPFPFFWLIIFLAVSVWIAAAHEGTFNSLFTGAPAAFLYQNYFVPTKTLHSMCRNLFLSLRKNTCSCSSIDRCLLWNTYVKTENKYPFSDWE